MGNNNATGLNFVPKQELDKIIKNPSNSGIAKDPKKLKERITDLLKGDTEFSKMKQGDKILVVSAASGLFTAVLPLLAVGATLAIPGAMVGLALYFAVKVAVKAVQYGYKGLEWSAEKTVEGAKHTAEKVKDASTYAAGKIKDGVVYANNSLKRGTSHTLHDASQLLNRLTGKTNYSESMLNGQLFAGDVKEKIVSIKGQLMGIFNNKEIANKDKLLEKILKDIVLQIESKKDHAQGTGSEKYAPEWNKQINFINGLNAEKLHDLLTKQSSPKNTYFLYTIISEHYNKIEMTIRKCEKEHKLSSVKEKLSDVASTYGKRTGFKQSQSGGSEAKEPFSSDLGAIDIMPSAEIGNSTFYVASPELPRSNSTNSTITVNSFEFKAGTPAKTATIGKKPSGKQSTPVAIPTVPISPSSDNGIGSSGSSTSQGKPDYIAIGIEGNKIGRTDWGYYSDHDSGRSSPDLPTEKKLDSRVKKLVKQFDNSNTPNSLEDINVTGGIQHHLPV